MRLKFLFILTALFLSVASALAQTEREFVDETEGFRIALAGDWRAVSYTDAFGRRKTEFVYRERNEGLLKISKESLGVRLLAEYVQSEMEWFKQSHTGCIWFSSEPFEGGALRGFRVALYYIEGNHHFVATHYYFEDAGVVWALRFSGRVGSLDAIRGITDRMARSFRPLSFPAPMQARKS
jgi:hypothetical protein